MDYVKRFWDRRGHGIWHDMGTAKTSTALYNARELFHNHLINAVIVIAPNEVYLNWLGQIKLWAPEMSAVAWDSAYPLQSAKNWQMLVNLKGPKVFVINIEAMSRPKSQAMIYLLQVIKAMTPVLTIVDESTCIKNPKAQSTKNVLIIGKYSRYRRCLTGTPGVESVFDTWQQLEFISPGCTGYNHFMFTKAFGIWQKQYFGPRQFDKCVGFRNVEGVRRLLEEHGHFLRKEECVDLPEKLYETYEFDLPATVMTAYKEIKRKKAIELSGKPIAYDNAMEIVYQLSNIATGYVKHLDGTFEWVTQARLNALLELLEKMTGKAIIFCNSREGLRQLYATVKEKFGDDSCRLVFGDVPPEQRMTYIYEFQNKPEVRFFIANQQTAGRGVTLTAATYVIYFRNSYSLDRRLQSEDRAHRIGQTNNVTIVDIVARNTIDARIVQLLKEKKDVANQLLGIFQEEMEDR